MRLTAAGYACGVIGAGASSLPLQQAIDRRRHDALLLGRQPVILLNDSANDLLAFCLISPRMLGHSLQAAKVATQNPVDANLVLFTEYQDRPRAGALGLKAKK